MLISPVPRKIHISFSFILNRDLSLIKRKIPIPAITVTLLTKVVCTDVSPAAERGRENTPITPQPAAAVKIIKTAEVFLLFSVFKVFLRFHQYQHFLSDV